MAKYVAVSDHSASLSKHTTTKPYIPAPSLFGPPTTSYSHPTRKGSLPRDHWSKVRHPQSTRGC